MSALKSRRKAGVIVDMQGNPLTIENRAYEASATGRKLGGWDAPELGPNKAATAEVEFIRRRMHSLIRNNPWLSRGLKADIANEIGTGIIPRSKAPNKAFRLAMRELWNDYIPHADASGILSAYGIQWQAARARKESGEVFVRIRQRKLSDGLPIPVQFQVLEAAFCPVNLNKTASNGNDITSGIEIDSAGKRVAYWMYKKHPHEGMMDFSGLVRVPAEQIIHHYVPLRPGQMRGDPNAVQAMVRAHVFDKYDDAELTRKETRSQFTGVIHRPDYGEIDYQYDPISGLPIATDGEGIPMLDLETGTFPSLLPGENIELFNGDETGAGYEDFQRRQLLAVAAGQDVPYELTTGDYRGINDRVWRAIMNQYRKEVEQTQDLITIQQVCRVMWDSVVDAAVLSGAISAPNFETKRHEYLRADHTAPAWPSIHPLQDANARKVDREGGLESRQQQITKNNRDPIKVDEERAEDMNREKDLKLTTEASE